MTDGTNTASTLADILGVGKRIEKIKGLEEFGLVLFMRSITEAESAAHEAFHWKPNTTDIDPNRLKRSRAALISLVVCDEHGNKLLSANQAGDLDSRLAEILFDQCRAFTKAPKPGKNSEAANDGDSPSDSRPSSDE